MIDTHCHLNFQDFREDYKEVWQRAQTAGVGAGLVVGSNFETSRRAVEISQELEGLKAAVGLHPIHVADEIFDLKKYLELASQTKVVAIGEIGLDYFHNEKEKVLQAEILREFLKLAQELNLPCVLHCRGNKSKPFEAYDDLLKILKDFPQVRGVLHCFTADWEIAEKYLARGFYLGFTGVVTFADGLGEVAARVPLNQILLETDCPYLAPAPKRGERCEPADVFLTAKFIATIKKISLADLKKNTDENARKLFGL